MMTYTEAKKFNERYRDALRRLGRMRKTDLAELLARQDRADGRTRLIGGPRTKDELIRELLDLDFTHAQLNEATHVLWHAPNARWGACEHCQARPATETVNTSELRPGDVVLEHGMRVRVDEVREYRPQGSNSAERAWCCWGTVLNRDDVVRQHAIPASFLETYGYREGEGWVIERRDAWMVHGNALTAWTIELPRPAAPKPIPPQPPMTDDMADNYLHHLADRQADQ